MVGNEIGLIRSFSILMCKTRRLSLAASENWTNVTKCTGYSTIVTIRVFDDDVIFHRKRVEDGVLSWNARTRTTKYVGV